MVVLFWLCFIPSLQNQAVSGPSKLDPGSVPRIELEQALDSVLVEPQKVLKQAQARLTDGAPDTLSWRALEALAQAIMGEKETASSVFADIVPVLQEAMGKERAEGRRMFLQRLLGACLTAQGILEAREGQNEAARRSFSRATDLLSQTEDDVLRYWSLSRRNGFHIQLSEHEQALHWSKKAFELARAMGDDGRQARSALAVAKTFRSLGDTSTAREWFETALEQAKTAGTHDTQALALNELGNLCMEAGENQPALEYKMKALAAAEKTDNVFIQAVCLVDMGVLLWNTGQFDGAIRRVERATEVFENLGARREQAYCLHNLGVYQLQMGDLESAEQSLRQAVAVAEEHGLTAVLVDCQTTLASILEQRGHFAEACEAMSKAFDAQAKVHQTENQRLLAELRAEFETEKKEQQIAILERDRRIQNLRLERRQLERNVILAGLLLLLLLLAIFCVLFGRRILVSMRFWRRKHFVAHFRILEVLGKGGAGTVYRARNLQNGQQVALKVLDEHGLDKTMRERFIREGLLNEHLTHPNVIQVYEKGEINDSLYYAMELVDGITLRDQLEIGPFSPKTATALFIHLLDILHDIHEAGIMHRDIKPANIMITRGKPIEQSMAHAGGWQHLRSRIKILDFGLARIAEQKSLTQTGTLAGTLCYMAPEYVMGEKVRDKALDFYALGVVLYEMYCGQRPYEGQEAMDVVGQILIREPRAPRTVRPDLPQAASDLAMHLIAKKPSQRLMEYQAIRDRTEQVMAGFDALSSTEEATRG